MDPITMMVASIGMQFFNNYANSDKNKEIQDKQREFQKAAAEHDFERMRKLQAESAKLALELEAEVHKERAEDINSNYDALLENFAHSFAIQNWPLNVLPFIMKGESFGSLFKGTTKSVNMHCIFTPSNCDWFNRMFYDDIDLRLEAEMNNNWNAQTTHPIVYYGGGWNRRTVLPHGISIPNLIDLDDIGLLETNLKNVPVMVVTPYFDPWLHFRVKIWGMGKDSEVPFRIDIPHGTDIEFSKRIFSYDYNKDMKEEMTEDFINTTIEEFVPYMESLIGFVADKYFWGMYGIAPKLPNLLEENKSCLQKFKTIFSDKIGKVYDKFNNISKEQIDFVEIEVPNLSNIIIFAKDRMDKAINPTYFAFIVWNSKILIGTYCSKEMKVCTYSKEQTARYFILKQQVVPNSSESKELSLDCEWNGLYYILNLNNNKTSKMEKESFEAQFGRSFERIGKGLGRIVDGLNAEKKQIASDLCANTTDGDNSKDGIEKIVSYFIDNAGRKIPAERVENMSMKKVLDWVDSTVIPFADKVYLVKGIHAEYKKYVFCVFYGAGEKTLLKENDPCMCFIASECNEEMAQTFGNNDICVIPLK